MRAQAGKARTAILLAFAGVLLLAGCPDAAGRLTRVMASDGVWLDAIRIGSGPQA